MKNQFVLLTVFSAAVLATIEFNVVAAESARVTADVNKPGHAVPITLHGLFFEDINCGADGSAGTPRSSDEAVPPPSPPTG